MVSVGAERYTVCGADCRRQLLVDAAHPPKEARKQRRIAVLNQKGGTGKTTTAVSLAAGLVEAGKKVLLIDADPQGHCAVSLGVRGSQDLYDVMTDGVDPLIAAVEARPGLFLLSSTEKLAAVEIQLARRATDRHTHLKARMRNAAHAWDYVIVDCGPSLSLLNTNVMLYCDELLVPVACDYLSLVGVRHILRTVDRLHEHFSHPVRLLGFLPTMYDRRNRLAEDSVAKLQGRFADAVLEPIRINVRLKEAPSHQQTIFEYASDSRGADDYRQLVQTVIRQEPPEA